MKNFKKIISFVLVLVLTLGVLVSCSSYVDYANDDLSKYISLSEGDYKNIALSLTNRDSSDASVQKYIDDLLFAARKYRTVDDDNHVIKLGETVDLFYRVTVDGEDYTGVLDGIAGYTQDSSGATVAQNAASTNMMSQNASSIYLGENSMCKLFEAELGSGKYKIGDFSGTNREVKTEGTVESTDTVYVTYTKSYKNNIGKQITTTYNYRRIVLDGNTEFAELVGKTIGTGYEYKKTENIDGVQREVTYSGAVNFSSEETYKDIEITFPSDYSIDALKGKTATFHVILKNVYVSTDEAAKKGDTVYTYYRGVILESSDSSYVGTVFDSNYGNSIYAVAIGSGKSIGDFENGFIGKGASGIVTDVKTDGKIKDVLFTDGNMNDMYLCLYLSATYVDENGGTVSYISGRQRYVRTVGDVNSENHESKLSDVCKGLNLSDFFKDSNVSVGGDNFSGTQKVNIDGTDRNVTFEGYIRFAVDANNISEETYIDDVKFPDDYSTSQKYLNGAKARFYVVIDHVMPAQIPELTAQYITDTLKFESDKTGDELISAFKQHVKDYLTEQNRTAEIEEASDQIWNTLMEKTTVKKYPKKNVKEEREAVYNEIKNTYNSYKNDSTYGSYFSSTYPTLNKYIIAQGSLESESQIEDYLDNLAESRVKEKMILYYLVDSLQISLSDEEYQKAKDTLVTYLANYYSTTTEKILNSYSEDSIRMQIYSNLVVEKLYEMNVASATRTDAE